MIGQVGAPWHDALLSQAAPPPVSTEKVQLDTGSFLKFLDLCFTQLEAGE